MRAGFVAFAIIALGFGGAARAGGQDRPPPPLYYQDPDGKPFYAAGPRQTQDGRPYRPVFVDGVVPLDDATPKAAPASRGHADHRVLYYRNPMGLPDNSPKPKKDTMGMDYLPVYADEGAQGDSPGTVRISPGRLQTLGVRTEAAQMRPMAARSVRATGILQFNERRLATVTTKVPGWIEHLAVAATGDPVKRGQVLAEIYSPDLVASEEEYLIAAGMGGPIARASVQRLHALDIPDAEIARLRHSGRSARRVAVVAPKDGVVIDKPVQEGMRVEAGEALYKTADLSDVWLIAQIQEQDLGSIRPGQPAHANFVAFPGRTFEGRVDFIYPSLSAETRTAHVRIVLPNPDGTLRAGMFANVGTGAPADGEPVLSVPNSAVLDSGTRQVVLVARGEGRFEPRPVRLGVHGDNWVEVLSGIKPGDPVVVGANFLIDAESNLRAALQGFTNGAKAKSAPQGDTP
jgi:membrane fusion protein, copper/silver efflux system